MSIQLTDIEVLNQYLEAAMQRAAHHAMFVRNVALMLVGPVIWYAEPDSLRVRTHLGNKGNVLWATIGGQRYVFCLNHKEHGIEVRSGNLQGATVHIFHRDATMDEICGVFAGLGKQQQVA